MFKKFGNKEAEGVIELMLYAMFGDALFFMRALKYTGIILSIGSIIAVIVSFIIIYNS